jgi:hypothetical protein
MKAALFGLGAALVASAANAAGIGQALKHTRYSVPLPTVSGVPVLGLPFGPHFLAGLPICMITAALVGQAEEGRRLTRREGQEIAAGCLLPFIGPWIVDHFDFGPPVRPHPEGGKR